MDTNNLALQEFQQVHGIISLRRNRALQTVNNENLLVAWEVGTFSARLKNAVWGSKTVMQLSEYLRSQDPTLRGYSRRNIYNMVAFYEAYLDNMKDFVLELGKDFLFYDKEFSLQVGNSTFKVDLLFFHRGLQCLVAIELKTGKFKPEYMGQLEFYLEALDRDVRLSNENPSIGILLCQAADRSVVEYAMSRSLSPTMIAEYERQLIPKEILQRSLNEFCNFLKK
ncbi:hypothetical protein FACS1894199_15870 [Bacteroidia bacterium]|nr:hypothetical protein FACS1894199_15870 [Bacteroidia bacterium]